MEKVQKKLRKGILIAIEGIDGGGKTEQTRLLFQKLKFEGYPVSLFHEPSNGKWGQQIKNLLSRETNETNAEAECRLFLLDREENILKNIKPALNKKQIVVMDRYYFSNVAYQGAKGLNPNLIEEQNKRIAEVPNLVIILDLPAREAIKRIKNKRKSKPDLFEKERYLKRVRKLFIKSFSGRANVYVIKANGNRTIEEIADEIWKITNSKIQEMQNISNKVI